MELSAWYENMFRLRPSVYGFAGDREIKQTSHLFWARALLAYTFPKSKQSFSVSLTGGASLDADRFSAYRLGGILPMASEFPLTLPGYYYQEISAQKFVLFGGQYSVPLGASKSWALNFVATTAAWNTCLGSNNLAGGIQASAPGSLIAHQKTPGRCWSRMLMGRRDSGQWPRRT